VLTALASGKFIWLNSKLKKSKEELLKQQGSNKVETEAKRKSFAIADTADQLVHANIGRKLAFTCWSDDTKFEPRSTGEDVRI
jgi:hypothetical protein